MTAPRPDAPPATPGVRFPPPLIFLLGIGAGIALDRVVRPWPLIGGETAWWLYPIAGAFALLAMGLMGGALGVFQESEKGQLPLVSSKVPYRILAIDIAVGREILYPRLERR